MSRVVRTVQGDISPEELGVCYAHEHIIIEESITTLRHTGLHLPSEENAITELKQFHRDAGRAMVESMPCDAGRNVTKLAAISRATGVHILCPTGIHLAKYYEERHWSHHYSADQLADLFTAEVQEGIDRFDYSGPLVDRTPHKAGLVKIASGAPALDERDRRVFAAAAETHLRTGAPLLTHTEQGRGGIEQLEALRDLGVDLGHVVLSHTDRHPDVVYHNEMLASGVCLEYDSGFRWPSGDNPTLELVLKLMPDYPDQILLGMDAARPAYWTSYGGSPGLSFLLTDFSEALKSRGLTDVQWRKIFIESPARTYALKERSTS